jgi:lysophospholipase L1-like esterase
VLCASAIGACSSSPSGPTAPALSLQCPAPQTVASPTGLAIPVTFALPTATGGTAPIATTCSPASGVNYPIGTTSVTCTALDANRQTATCGLLVTVTAPPRLSVTRYIAFGDSITEGFPHTISPALLDPAPDGSYPLVLQSLLRARYTAQTIAVLDEGVGGEIVGDGLKRLPGVLTSDAAGALLLMEGANDLNQSGIAAPDIIVSGLRNMVKLGRERSMRVFVGTLLPERANGKASHPELVAPTNDKIGLMATTEDAVLVDLFAAFGGVPDPVLISSDGLHPTAAGNERIAQTFFAAIRARLEAPAAFTPNATFGSVMQAPSVTIGAAIRPIIPVAQAFRPAGAGGSPEGLRYK